MRTRSTASDSGQKAQLRDQIRSQVQEFLARGGRIRTFERNQGQVPGRLACRASDRQDDVYSVTD